MSNAGEPPTLPKDGERAKGPTAGNEPDMGALFALKTQVSDNENSFNRKRNGLRRFDYTIFLIQAIFILMTTIFAGLQLQGYESILKNAAFVSSALASFLTIIIGRFVFRER